jgi:hypothetical protein
MQIDQPLLLLLLTPFKPAVGLAILLLVAPDAIVIIVGPAVT